MSTGLDAARPNRYKARMPLPDEHDVGVSRSSSASLSSPPHTSPEPGSPSAQVANESSHSIIVNNQHIPAAPAAAPVLLAGGVPEKPPRKKPGRKPKPIDPNDPNPPKVRRPRVKKEKDPNAPVLKRAPRKSNSVLAGLQAVAGYRQASEPTFVNLVHSHSQSQPSASGNHDPIHNQPPQQPPIQSFFNAPPPPPQTQSQTQPHHIPQPVRTSGQNYDPIRSNSNYDPIRDYANPQGSPSHPPPMNRASASPSISSLVDPPNQSLTSPSIAAQSFFNQQQLRFQRDEQPSVPPSPTTIRLAPSVMTETSAPPAARNVIVPTEDGPAKKLPSSTAKKTNGSTATSSAGASPKPGPKLKDAKDIYPTPPPLPGSGLMQLGGIGGGPNDGTEFRAPTVVLNIPMNGETNKYVNFTRMAEERYGWDALHPRLAAQRDRLARVAAAGAAIERSGSNRDSGDDMSLDSEGEGSNVEMGGMSDARTGTDGGAKKVPRKRKMKEDEYDKDDGFVDDTDLLWEEQAAATNDGFFVYSGPLVPEGEKPTLDLRADGAPKRGRGRGSRGGATGGRGSRTATLAGTGRGGLPLSGPGSRGGSTTRKPRITKADRARMEQEKKDREQMGSLSSMPSAYSGGMTLASAANMGNTPLVFNQ